MFERLRTMLRGGDRHDESRAPADLVTLDRAEIRPFIYLREDLPRIDWGAVDAWIGRRADDRVARQALLRGAAAVWLDELRDALTADHKRWRHARVEGLAPVAEDLAAQIAAVSDRAIVAIEKAMVPIRGDERVPPLAVVALDSDETYYTFIAHHDAEEGEWGTSGGMYINDGEDSLAVIALPAQVKHGIGSTIAHEMTHHALHGMDLPLWVEEGFTQMMEERVTGYTGFKIDQEMMARHRERWGTEELDRFVAGESFSSPLDDEQELSYHLSQLVVRGWLARDPGRFFAYARACRETGPESACAEHLGGSAEDIIQQAIGG